MASNWSIPDDNHEGKGFIAVLIFLGVIDFLCVLVRLYSRYIQDNSFYEISDYVLVLGFIMMIGVIVVIWGSFSHGYGEDLSKYTQADTELAWKLFIAIDILWNGAATAVRVSMILLYRQIFEPVRKFGLTCLAFSVINILNWLAAILATFLICSPISYIYVRIVPGRCGNVEGFQTYTAVASFILDAAVVILPMPQLWKLQMKTKKKIGISIVLSLGVFICATTLMRIIISYVYMVDNITKQSAVVAFASGLEPILGCIIACLPFFPGVIRHLTHSRTISALTSKKSAVSSAPATSAIGKQYSSRTFKRLEDIELDALRTDYTTVEGQASKLNNKSHASRSDEDASSWMEFLNEPVRGPNNIYVRKDITIREDAAQRVTRM